MREMYSALGRWFEYLNEDCGYEQWSQYLIKKLELCGAGKTGADLGCGNGYFTRALNKAGYTVTGVDVSAEMLSAARRLDSKQGMFNEYILSDVLKLNLGKKIDFAVAVNDCFNYIGGENLVRAFKRVAANLKKGGVFVFDVSSEYKLKNIIGDNIFSEDGDDLTYIWFNSLKEDRVEMDITLFERRPDGLYNRRDESQTQYIHTEEKILSALAEAGFSAQSEGHLGGDKKERINFICKKL